LYLSSSPQEQAETLVSIREGIRLNEPAFVASMAVHLAEQKNFRQIAILLSAELAAQHGNDEHTGILAGRIIRQASVIPEWLDQYGRAAMGQKPGRVIRKHLSVLFNRLDEYQVSRYNRETQTAVAAALRFLQPKPDGRPQKALFSKILRDQLPARLTWEQEWHALHQQHYDSPEQRQVILRDKWKEGISSFRIGYTALLDNVQPMLCAGVSGKVLKLAAEYLGNAAAVAGSYQSPLRLLDVYRSLRLSTQGGTGMLTEALEHAVLSSTWSRSDFGRGISSVIAMDVSNSMKRPVNGAGNAQRFDIGPLLAAVWKQRGEKLITGIIGNTWKPVDMPARPVLGTADEFRQREGEAGYAINAHLVLQDLLRKRQAVHQVLIFTDNKLWAHRSYNQPAGSDLGEWWRLYRQQVAPNAKLFLFNLAGYDCKPLEQLEDEVYLVAGWHERVIDVLEALTSGKTVLETLETV
jgi:hypothetical protein